MAESALNNSALAEKRSDLNTDEESDSLLSNERRRLEPDDVVVTDTLARPVADSANR
jgi:hypothetical protein